jgi:hypothetical protein
MICIVATCHNELWRATRKETEDAAEADGWRFMSDGKTPALSAGAALCPEHADQAPDFQPAPPKERTR